MEILYAKFDGSQLPILNKGTAACVLYTKTCATPQVIRTASFDVSTSGEAEFAGLILALETISANLASLFLKLGEFSVIRVYGDCQVLFKHVRGTATPSCPKTALLATTARQWIKEIEKWGCAVELYWTPRKNNILADILCRIAYSLPAPLYTPYSSSPLPPTPYTQSQANPGSRHESNHPTSSDDPSPRRGAGSDIFPSRSKLRRVPKRAARHRPAG